MRIFLSLRAEAFRFRAGLIEGVVRHLFVDLITDRPVVDEQPSFLRIERHAVVKAKTDEPSSRGALPAYFVALKPRALSR